MSGHNKWANIKYRKERQDKKRSGIFAKLIKEITLQARNGDPNPENNPGLAHAIERARAANLPKENIERAIKRATGELDGVSYEEITYEGYGPEGVAILVRVVTDNRNRAAAAVRHIFSKHGGNLAAAGSVAWLFERRGVLTLEQLPDEVDKDELLMNLIELGAQEFDDQGDLIEVYCSPNDLAALTQEVGKLGITPTRAEVTMIPKNTVHVEGTAAEKVLKLIDALDDNEDVQEVFANFDIPDEILAKVEGG
ncbi:YebC/PmpR family DNA-binding transcriptional regulator [Candidatus Acetothermia bacterium]|nr:MAG: YebC/PmpR family DNA-binding transcriptional regulator [Candidatus Acetothermia bacterium]